MVTHRDPPRVRWIAIRDTRREFGNAHRAVKQQSAIEQRLDFDGRVGRRIAGVDADGERHPRAVVQGTISLLHDR